MAKKVLIVTTFWRKNGTAFPVECSGNPITGEAAQQLGTVVTWPGHLRATGRGEDERWQGFVSRGQPRTAHAADVHPRGALGLLSAGVLGEVNSTAQRMLEIAVNNTERLIRLINDFLDLERISSGKVIMRKTTCQVGELMRSAVEIVRPLALASGIGDGVQAFRSRPRRGRRPHRTERSPTS